MKYFVTIVDDCTNYSWTLPVRHKSEVATTAINLGRLLNNRFQIKTKVFRMDGDGEFLNHRLQRLIDRMI